MTSLADAYQRDANGASQRRVYAGTALFGAGALLVVAGILAGATHLVMGPTPSTAAKFAARELGLTLGCLGVPAIFVGVFTVLPASRFYRVAAAGGALVAVAGTLVLRYAYPMRWYAGGGSVPSTTALAGALVYVFGLIVIFWCLFTAVATFKTRNAPGGTVTLTVTEDGQTKTVEVPREDLDDARAAVAGDDTGSFGGVGVFGGVERGSQDHGPQPTSDGGATTPDVREVTGERGNAGEPSRESGGAGASADADVGPDRYCGSCTHFDYVRTDDDDIKPYCGHHDELMDDMDACEAWTRE
ncbi:uncharacterized membrane protein HdeD (DUF308 family) [Halarchaeum rubridurum]|uniref:Uncharacterized membrane protein HdeD (DUF308 family) n=1 Tax=Halarchaeum rubridurum TaxID=489911 RepID=A0A830G1D1_9EURY|nr:hypothetical protein [Halarchaeum rubridurum]MBP1955270.1 uncharacterized membrane protein HdeD (DUF308 family) [Halarchaeum rubridurum]GGM70831.1 hypothetical protein GCM10009017_21260 [Halarchaeum rubridurum]